MLHLGNLYLVSAVFGCVSLAILCVFYTASSRKSDRKQQDGSRNTNR